MEKIIPLEIYTPKGKYLSVDADFIKVQSSVAVLGILPNHAPLITKIEICPLTIRIQGKDYLYAVGGGILNIKKDHSAVLLLDSIERSDEIDYSRAEESKKRAEERLEKITEEIDIARAKASLSRALNRLSVRKE